MGPNTVWYVAYGSNLGRARFHCYVAGGRPEGGRRQYVGCRDRTAPTAEISLDLPGGIVFAGRSRAWGGGKAFYDRQRTGTVAARAYLVTVDQFADIVAQESWRSPGGDLASLIEGCAARLDSTCVLGAGAYETLHRVGEHRGSPLLTITNDDLDALPLTAPEPAYLWWIATGLVDAHGWTPDRVGAYLSTAPGASQRWSSEAIAELVEQPHPATHA